MPKILGRDPALWVGVVESALLLALSFGWLGLTDTHVGAIMAAVNAGFGLLTAVLTKRAGLSMAIGLLKSLVTLAAVYGFTFTEGQETAVIGLATVVLTAFNWSNNSPADQPALREE
jgi:hypothetical protein